MATNMEFTTEEMELIGKAFKLAKMPIKYLESHTEIMFHSEDVVELWWRNGFDSVSIDSQGYQMVWIDSEGEERFIGSTTARNLVKMIHEGKHGKRYISSFIEGAKAKR